MPNLCWDNLNSLQLGRYAEYYAKMEFASYGFEIYTSEVDDHGVDFIMKYKKQSFYEIQVKSLRESNKGNYIFITKDKMDVTDTNRLICFIHFRNDQYPVVYIIPASVWKNPNNVFVSRDYIDKKSEPEWGINYSKKNRDSLDNYLIQNFIKNIMIENNDIF
jgi:hypothetical protein